MTALPTYEAATGPLFLADLSGYTSFLRGVQEAHKDDAFAGGQVPGAYRLMSGLLDGIVQSVTPYFTISKLEGDAVFAFARSGPGVPHGNAVLECIRACYARFQAQLADVDVVWTCTCNSCNLAYGLDLKFVLHAGGFVVQEIGGKPELTGTDVVMAHLLLKSNAAALVGSPAYALITEAAAAELAVPVDTAVPMTVSYEHFPPINTFVMGLS
jgi:hypothetical protein